jgi:hypothetical protein
MPPEKRGGKNGKVEAKVVFSYENIYEGTVY